MPNSSLIYSISEESADIATPYITFGGQPREVDWQSFVILGEDSGPPG